MGRRSIIVLTVLLGLWIGASTGVLLRTELAFIRGYQEVGSPIVSKVVSCRFHPTCSNYALQALTSRGIIKGNIAIAGRLLHCSPIGIAADWFGGREVFPESNPKNAKIAAGSTG